MLRLLITTVFASLLFACQATPQSLIGSWTDPTSGAVYEFAYDGTGRILQDGTEQPFVYAIENGVLTFGNAAGSVSLAIESVTATQATFRRADGVPVALVREAPASAGEVLASSSAGQLTEGDVMAAVRIVEFVTGEYLSEGEIEGVRAESIQDFENDPAGLLDSIEMFRTVLGAAAQASDPVAVGMARQQLLVSLLNMRAQMPDEPSAFFDAMTDRVRLVAFDANTGTGATDRDVEDAVEYLAWLSETTGSPAPASAAEYEAYVASSFSSLPQSDREFLSAASVIWALVQAQWNGLSASQQAAAQSQLNNELTASDMLQTQADAQQTQQYYQMMSQMSAMSHQTSMSIINNMGGGSSTEMWQTDVYGNPTIQIW
ncbi:MAG: hypothetical protein AAGI08_12480 [Bacteroidota bacterium]